MAPNFPKKITLFQKFSAAEDFAKLNAQFDEILRWIQNYVATAGGPDAVDHAALGHLTYATAGHTGFQPSGSYLTAETDPVFNAWLATDAFEPALGNPGVDGYVLSSTMAGVRSWIAAGEAETDPLSLHLDQASPQTLINGVPLMTTDVDGDGSGSQLVNKKYVDLAVSSLQLTEYFSKAALSPVVAGFYSMDNVQAGADTIQSGDITGTSGSPTSLFKFMTPVGHPHLDRFLIGVYEAHFYLLRAAGGVVGVRFQVWRCDAAGAHIGASPLGTSADLQGFTTSNALYELTMAIATEVALDTTDRLSVEWLGWKVSGFNTTVTMTVGGTSDSHLSIKVEPSELQALFVPYTGAEHDIDLGAKDIITTGDIEADALITTGGASTDFVKGNGSLDSATYLTPTGNGSGLTAVNADTVDTKHASDLLNMFFGDGSDGDVTLTASATLTRDMHYLTLTIDASADSANVSLRSDNFRIFARSIVFIPGATKKATILCNGNNGIAGGNASGGTGGTSGAGAASLTLGLTQVVGGPVAAYNGSTGRSTAGNGVTPTTAAIPATLPGALNQQGLAGPSNAAGKGGNAGAYTGGNGAAAYPSAPIVAPTNTGGSWRNLISMYYFCQKESNTTVFARLFLGSQHGNGSGGGSGAASIPSGSAQSGGGGGGGGCGGQGGVVWIWTKTISGTGFIQTIGGNGAIGGNGGNGFYAGAGVAGGGGGGGGGHAGDGGFIMLVYYSIVGSLTLDVTAGTTFGTGGTGGTGANGGANGGNGADGLAGRAGTILQFTVS